MANFSQSDVIAILVPTTLAASGVIVGAIRAGVNSLGRRIDSSETRLTIRVDGVSKRQDKTDRVQANHGERISYLEGQRGIPRGTLHTVPVDDSQDPE